MYFIYFTDINDDKDSEVMFQAISNTNERLSRKLKAQVILMDLFHYQCVHVLLVNANYSKHGHLT